MLWIVLVGCGGASTNGEQAAPSADVAQAAILEKADAHDGEVDHVVHECTGCGLAMKGDPAHASTVGEYELHFCSASCKSRFDEDPAKGVQGLGGMLVD